MSERSKPYVGVSGVVNLKRREPSGLVVTEPQQLFLEAAAVKSGLLETGRRLALGAKAVHQTQWSDEPFVRGGETYGPEWYPVGADQFRDAMSYKRKHPQTFGVMQMYFDRRQVHDFGYRTVFLARTAYRARKWAEGVQFDSLPWHEDDRLLQLFEQAKGPLDLETIVQCHEGAMKSLGPRGAADKLGHYADALDYVLFDASHGMGKTLDIDTLDPFLEEAYSSDKLSRVGFAVAGGLDAQTVQELLPALLEKYPDLSWDAERKLHPLNNVGTRPLQMDEVKKYFRASTMALEN